MKNNGYENGVRRVFNSFCKTVLRNEARNCQREARHRQKHEIPFAELPGEEAGKLAVCDEYPSDFVHFGILGQSVAVRDEALAEAIAALPPDKRDIILLAYFLDMTDREIAASLGQVRSTVQYRRRNSLALLHEFLKGDDSDDD